MRDQHDIPVLLTGCLAAGGAGMFLIMSVLIGFGVLSTRESAVPNVTSSEKFTCPFLTKHALPVRLSR